ncbi:flagellar assembly protein FliW [Pseudobacteriovorax antillogorgiicola]|uniref:Flagellar assembly factor FliW n=1 Tax=Pseudobacteriovorax antillogorgiicola TaxID=1513793 RepID=A0A1Y6B253_9BACT|nr:flagellar assembly protein FliW [Pseudobacteriovorax antillogorgiicola]TCS59535.1 flagellar assembly factor FliW [Pseudobacteriovorax antillogorgiicola]SME87811.1 flagellar assembly factor FliW [Pseudobacteriovorax antillogorgiicola]
MIKVKTTRFSEIEVDEKDVIELPAGLIGFPELKKYVLLDHDKNSPFKWLQSLSDGAIAFVLINPLLFKPDYTVEVNEAEVADLDLDNEEDAVISVIITMPSDPQKMTANLKAPLVFNLKNRKGRQVILNNSEYTTRHNIMEEVKKRSESGQNQEMQEMIGQAKRASQASHKAEGQD